MRVYNAESPKQDSRRFNSIVKTKYIDDLGIVYLWGQVYIYIISSTVRVSKVVINIYIQYVGTARHINIY